VKVTYMKDNSKPTGIFAASLTPMNDDLTPNLGKIIKHNRWLLSNGCDGVAPLGTTGEANSLSVDERLSILDALADAGISGNRLIAGVGCCALTDTVNLTKRAVANGAGGVLMLPPFYYKEPSDDGLFAAYSNVIERVGHESLQIYLYNFPQQVGFDLSVELVARLHDAFPNTIVGMKDSSGDWPRMKKILSQLSNFRLFPGSEEFLLPSLHLGGVGCISATVNVTAPYAEKLYNNWNSETSEDQQNHLSKLRKAFSGMAPIPAMKSFFADLHGDSGWANVRPPFLKASEANLKTAKMRLDELDFIIDGS
jgi:4-hydroxy-tetrahydrodipicolinate synthase